MSHCLPDNVYVNATFKIVLQVLLIFMFLTVFFFAYVGSVETQSFRTQMDLVVDDLAKDIDIKSFVHSGEEDLVTAIIDGSLELARKKGYKDSASQDAEVRTQNKKIMDRAIMWIIIAAAVLVVITLLLYFWGYCIPFTFHIKEAVIAVAFVALVEFIFLIVITKNYWSIDPATVRRKLGDTIQSWIQEHEII